jgi:hypothetical protein
MPCLVGVRRLGIPRTASGPLPHSVRPRPGHAGAPLRSNGLLPDGSLLHGSRHLLQGGRDLLQGCGGPLLSGADGGLGPCGPLLSGRGPLLRDGGSK